MGGDAIFAGSSVVGEGLNDVAEVIRVTREVGVVGAPSAVLNFPGQCVNLVGLGFAAVVEVG